MSSSFYPAQGSRQDTLTGKTLVLPSVSLANLPQLAVDLLINSLALDRIGYIGLGDTVAPLMGSSKDGLVTGGLEVYGKDGLDFVVVQQRSPNLKNKKDEHVNLLMSFIEETKPSAVLLLTSLDAANQDDQSLLTPHISIIPPSASPTAPLLSSLTSLLPPLQIDTYPPFIPGGGLSRRLLSVLQNQSPQIPHGAIGAWCVEGDNRQDAHALAGVVLHVLGKDGVAIREPEEWAGLFGVVDGWSGGAGADSELYG